MKTTEAAMITNGHSFEMYRLPPKEQRRFKMKDWITVVLWTFFLIGLAAHLLGP